MVLPLLIPAAWYVGSAIAAMVFVGAGIGTIVVLKKNPELLDKLTFSAWPPWIMDKARLREKGNPDVHADTQPDLKPRPRQRFVTPPQETAAHTLRTTIATICGSLPNELHQQDRARVNAALVALSDCTNLIVINNLWDPAAAAWAAGLLAFDWNAAIQGMDDYTLEVFERLQALMEDLRASITGLNNAMEHE
jgi:hypothetical protein